MQIAQFGCQEKIERCSIEGLEISHLRGNLTSGHNTCVRSVLLNSSLLYFQVLPCVSSVANFSFRQSSRITTIRFTWFICLLNLCESTCGCSNQYLNLWQFAWITIQLTIVNQIVVILENCQNEKLATLKTHGTHSSEIPSLAWPRTSVNH